MCSHSHTLTCSYTHRLTHVHTHPLLHATHALTHLHAHIHMLAFSDTYSHSHIFSCVLTSHTHAASLRNTIPAPLLSKTTCGLEGAFTHDGFVRERARKPEGGSPGCEIPRCSASLDSWTQTRGQPPGEEGHSLTLTLACLISTWLQTQSDGGVTPRSQAVSPPFLPLRQVSGEQAGRAKNQALWEVFALFLDHAWLCLGAISGS